MATPAAACKKALEDATKAWPNRNRASDGIMADARHKAIKSDHNEGLAFDLTHDPANGVDCVVLSRQVITDPRVTYVIFNRQIYNRSRASEGWRSYTGSNAHTHHMHVSIRPESRNDLSPWPWSEVTTEAIDVPIYPGRPVPPIEAIKAFQRYYGLTADGIVGPITWELLFKENSQ